MATTFHPNEVGAHTPELQKRFLDNPVMEWCGRFMQADRRHPTPVFHLDMTDRLLTSNKHVVKAPRGSAKSITCGKKFLTYLACNYKQDDCPVQIPEGVIYISNTGPVAKTQLAKVKREIELNERIKAQYGDLAGDVWREDYIELTNGFWVRAIGRGSQARGYRAGLIIADDLDDAEAVRSETQRDKAREWWDTDILPILDESDCRCVVIGTNLHPLALINYIASKEGWTSDTYRALQADGSSIWPSKWSVERLGEMRREMGTRQFNAEYQNEPIITENPIFYPAWFRRFNRHDAHYLKDIEQGVYTVAACDPAISRDENADYTAIVTLSATFGKEPKIYVRPGGVVRGHWPLNRTVNQLATMQDKFGIKQIGIETTAYQQALADEFKRYMDDNHRAINTLEIKPDKDKERRAHAVAPMVERGQVWIDESDEMSRLLLDELMLFPTGDHDDLVDAFVHALGMLKQWSGRPRGKIVSALDRAAW